MKIDLIRFGSWAQRLGRAPTISEIRAEFPHIDRATAYRWRRDLLRVWGVESAGWYLRTAAAPRTEAA